MKIMKLHIEGINVNKAKKVIYLLFAFDPLMSISIFKESFNFNKNKT